MRKGSIMDSLKKIINYTLALLTLFFSMIVFYKLSIWNISDYNAFIFGDTIYENINKNIDIYFISFLALFSAPLCFIFQKINICCICIYFIKKFLLLFTQESNLHKFYSNLKKLYNNIRENFSFISKFLYEKFTIFGFKFEKIASQNYINHIIDYTIIFVSSYCVACLLLQLGLIPQHIVLTITFIHFCLASICGKNKVFISQILLSFSPLLFLTEAYQYQEEIVIFENSIMYIASMLAISLCSLQLSWVFFKKNQEYITFSSITAIIVVLTGPLYRHYGIDEYHIGEAITAFHQVFTIGQEPYSEFIPTKGFMHIIYGFINELFFDGKYVTFGCASQLTTFFSTFLLAFIFKLFFSTYISILYIIVFWNLGLVYGHYYPIPIGLLLLNAAISKKNVIVFCLTYLFFMYIYFLYYNAFAIAFALSIFPAFIYSIYIFYTEKVQIHKIHIAFFLLWCIIITISIPYIYNSSEYVLTNSSNNILYWGNLGYFTNLILSNFWIAIFLCIIFYTSHNYSIINTKTITWLSFFTFIPFILLSYIEGRSDAWYYRAYVFSCFYLTLATIFCIYHRKMFHPYVNKLILTFLTLFAMYCVAPHTWTAPFSSFNPIAVNSKSTSYVQDSSIPNLGQGFIPEDRYEEVLQEHSLINVLEEEETFLLIDPYVVQSARYAIYNKQIPIKSHAILNISSLRAQIDELEKFKELHVEIIRLSKGILRYTIFYDYIFSQPWTLIQYGKHTYLVSDKIIQRIKGHFDFKTISMDKTEYSIADFSLLPIKWGSAFDSEKHLLTTETANFISKKMPSTPNTPHTYALRFKNEQSLNKYDLLTININIDDSKICHGQIQWGERKKENSINFKIRTGCNVIPVIMNMHWRDTQKLDNIKFSLKECNSDTVDINSIHFSKFIY